MTLLIMIGYMFAAVFFGRITWSVLTKYAVELELKSHNDAEGWAIAVGVFWPLTVGIFLPIMLVAFLACRSGDKVVVLFDKVKKTPDKMP